MKTLKKIILTILVFISFIGLGNAKAVSNVDYTVKNVYINSAVDIIGSMHITEAVVIEGSLNGFELEIDYKNEDLKEWTAGQIDFSNSAFYNARGVSLSKVSSFTVDNSSDIDWSILDTSYSAYEEAEDAESGDSGIYTKEDLSNGIKVRVYNPNNSGYVVYLFDYYINQAVVLHNDVAELYWNFFPKDFDYAENVNIQVTLPGTSTTDTFRFWAHGSLNGSISGISESTDDDGNALYQGVVATVTDVEEGSGVDIRMTFDKSLMSMASSVLNNSEEDALEKIIEVETERAEDANNQRKYIKYVYYGTIVLGSLNIIGLIALWIYLYIKYDKEYKVEFDAKYYREFTGEYNVEVIDYLMKKDVTTNAMSASIMNLIYKKNIILEEIPDDKKDMRLKLKTRENVNSSETLLIELLFDTIGTNGEVTLKQIEKYSKSASSADKFMKEYNKWKNSVIKDAKAENFYENLTSIKALAALYFIFSILVIIIILAFNVESPVLLFVIIALNVAFLVYIISFHKWTKKGREHYLKWQSFKNFLNDFGSFKDKEVPEIALWEKYLVYATIFGLAKKVQKSMKVYLTEMGSDTYITTYPYLYRDIYIADTLNTSINHAYSNSIATINAQNASSSMSSGSGFGGGFSSGGGFGGGGGGGHGF